MISLSLSYRRPEFFFQNCENDQKFEVKVCVILFRRCQNGCTWFIWKNCLYLKISVCCQYENWTRKFAPYNTPKWLNKKKVENLSLLTGSYVLIHGHGFYDNSRIENAYHHSLIKIIDHLCDFESQFNIKVQYETKVSQITSHHGIGHYSVTEQGFYWWLFALQNQQTNVTNHTVMFNCRLACVWLAACFLNIFYPTIITHCVPKSKFIFLLH